MSDRQKTATKKQFLSVSISESRRRAEEALNTKRLSITAENSGIIEIPFPTLEGMFKKAADTTNDESLTWKIPAPEDANNGSSSKSTFLVHSKSSHELHRVTVSTNGRVQCDKAIRIHRCNQLSTTFHRPIQLLDSVSASTSSQSDCIVPDIS
jgi:hypothetical protein